MAIELRGLAKSYDGVPALRDGTLTLAPGEVHALVGENGAGKSTLIRLLAGVIRPEAGEIVVDGAPVRFSGPADAFAAGFRFLHQELNVVPGLSVAENMALGDACPVRGGVFVDWRRLNDSAAAALARLGIGEIDPRRKMVELGPGDQMLARIAGSVGAGARLYVMDEPTAALNAAEAERLFAVVGQLRAAGAAVLYVSHRLDEVLRLSDRITVLRDGRRVETLARAEADRDGIVRRMTGREVSAAARGMAQSGAVLFEAEGLAGPGFSGAGFALRAGEVVGLAGLAGAGQDGLIRVLAGAEKARAGRMRLGGAPYAPGSPADAWAAGVAHVPRERRREGLVLSRPIAENVTLPRLAALSWLRVLLNRGREAGAARDLGARVRLKATGPGQAAGELSGGNQQKVVFARALLSDPRLLLLDEPSRGVDVGARADIHALVREMAGRGAAVLVASSDLSELLALSDRVLVMRAGRIVAERAADGLTEAEVAGLIQAEAAA